MERTSTFLSMTENDNGFRKPGALREGNAPKVAFNDLSNRVKRVFRSGTPQKTAFTGKKLTVFSDGDENKKTYDYYNFDKNAATNLKQKQDVQGSQGSLRFGGIEHGHGALNKINPFSSNENNEQVKEQVFVDAAEDINELFEFPEPESFYPTRPHELDYYESLPSPNRVAPKNFDYDYEDEFDIVSDLRNRYPYKDEDDRSLSLSPVEEKELNMYMIDSEDDDGNDSDGTYLVYSPRM